MKTSQWHRIGDFYVNRYKQKVCFRNEAYIALITKVELTRYSNGGTQVLLQTPPTSCDEFAAIYQKLFGVKINKNLNSHTFPFNCLDDSNKVIQLMEYINQKYKHERLEFPIAVINEIKTISSFVFSTNFADELKLPRNEHILPEYFDPMCYINPDQLHSQELANLLSPSQLKKENIPLEKFKTLICKGANINQRDSLGRTAIYHAANLKYGYKLKLLYNADPNKTSVLEKAKAYKSNDSFDSIHQREIYLYLDEENNLCDLTSTGSGGSALMSIIRFLQHKSAELNCAKSKNELIRFELITSALRDPDKSKKLSKEDENFILNKIERRPVDYSIFKLLLFYGFNPFSRDNGDDYFESAYDIIKKYQDRDLEEIILLAYSNPERKIREYPPLSIQIFSEVANVYTLFAYPNNQYLFTVMRNLHEVTSKSERLHLRKMFFQGFKEKLKTFNEDFSGNDKIIEMIFAKNVFVGFILFQKIKLKDNSIVINCLYAYLMEQYRFPGLMQLLTTRFDFSIQLLDPSRIISHFFSAINARSFAMINTQGFELLQYPKYNPHLETLSMEEIVNLIYGELTLVVSAMSSYVIDEAEAHSSKRNDKPNFLREMFEQFILGFHENDSQEQKLKRAATILYYVSDINFENLAKLFLVCMKINFFRHCYDLAKHLYPLVGDFLGETCLRKPVNSFVYSDALVLFFKKKKSFTANNADLNQHRGFKLNSNL